MTVALKVSDANDPDSFVIDTAQVQVNNVAPTASINLPGGSSFEGDEVTLTANVNDGFPNDGFTYEWSASDGTNSFSSSGPTLTFIPPDNGQYTVTLRVHDDDGGQVDATPANLQVQNAAPTAEITGGSANVDEGTPVVFGANTDDVDADTVSYNWSVKKDGVPYASGTNPTFGFTPDNNASYEVKLTVSDEDGGTSVEQTTVVTAANVSPQPDVTGDVGVRGELRTLALAATDPSSADTTAGFTFTVNWGDGSPVETFLPGTTEAHHTYEQNGTFAVAVTAEDQDDAVSEPFMISMITQTASLEGGVLLVSGGTGPDKVRVFRNAAGEVSVGMSDAGNGAPEFVQSYPGAVTRVVINTQGGDDQIDASTMNVPVEIYAGSGNDKLNGGTSADILVGGTGDDKLVGGPGRDLLIGGRDADKILGDTDEDVLVGGYSIHDGNVVALRLISDEWRSTRSYTTRVNNIRGTVLTNDRANGTTYMTADVTTWDDDAVDLLSGDAGRDWFFFNADTSTSKDKVVDADTLLEILDEVDMEP